MGIAKHSRVHLSKHSEYYLHEVKQTHTHTQKEKKKRNYGSHSNEELETEKQRGCHCLQIRGHRRDSREAQRNYSLGSCRLGEADRGDLWSRCLRLCWRHGRCPRCWWCRRRCWCRC